MSKFNIHKQRNEMLMSYIDAISKVGGCPELFLERIDKMTVWEMFEALAQNGVRFTTERESTKKLVKTDVWQFYDEGAWWIGMNKLNHKSNTIEGGYKVRDLYIIEEKQNED